MKDPELIIVTYKPDRYIIDPVESWDAYDIIFIRRNRQVFEIRIDGLEYETKWKEVLRAKLGDPSFFGNIPYSLVK